MPNTFEKGYSKISKKKFKLITAVAMFYDLERPINFVEQVKSILESDGIFHLEVAYLPEIVKTFSYDTFCQEHYEYYSLLSLSYIFKKTNMKIIDFGMNEINGGSIWLNVTHNKTKYKTNEKKIERQLKYEKSRNMDKIKTYQVFFNNVFNHAKKLNELIIKLKTKNMKVSGFGASTKGNVLLQLANIDNSLLDKIYDVNKEKFGKLTPITNIKIKDEIDLTKEKQDYLLILIWHFKKFIYKKIANKNKKIKLIIPFPKIKII